MRLIILALAIFCQVTLEEQHGPGKVRRQVQLPDRIDTADSICEQSPGGDAASLCKRLDQYKSLTQFKYKGTVLPVLSVDDQYSPSRELLLIDQNNQAADTKQKAAAGTKYVIETLGKTSEFVEKLRDAKKLAHDVAEEVAKKAGKTIKEFSKTFDSIGSIASMCGPLGAGVGMAISFIALFLETPDPTSGLLQTINEGLQEVNARFDKIDLKLDNLEFKVERSVVYQMYKENQDRIHKVMFALRQLFLNPGNLTLHQFKHICRSENPLYALEWIHRRSQEKVIGLHLFPTIFKDAKYDRTKLAIFYQVIMADMMTAAYLREACLGLQWPGNKNVLFKGRRVMGFLISGISKTMKQNEEMLIWSFKRSLVNDVQSFVDERLRATSMYDKIVNEVKDILKNKYYWLDWQVFLVKKDTVEIMDGGDVHYMKIDIVKHPALMLILIWSEPNQVAGQEKQHIAKILGEVRHKLQNNRFPELFSKLTNYFSNTTALFTNQELKQLQTISHFRDNKVVLIYKGDHLTDVLAKSTGNDTFNLSMSLSRDTGLCPSMINAMCTIKTYVYYYKSYEIAETFGCLSDGQKLIDDKIERSNVCPSNVFAKLINEKIKAMKPAMWSETNVAANQVHHLFKDDYIDFNWTIVAHKNQGDATEEKTFWGCKSTNLTSRDFQNCTQLYHGKYSFVVAWTGISDQLVLRQVNEARDKFAFVQKLYENRLIFEECLDMENLTQHVYDFISDPLTYFQIYGVSERKLRENIEKSANINILNEYKRVAKGLPLNGENLMNVLNFYENKVVIIGTSYVKSNADTVLTDLSLDPSPGMILQQSLDVKIIYYKPFEMSNTIHCKISNKDYQQTGLADRSIAYGC